MTHMIDRYLRSPIKHRIQDGTGEMSMGIGFLFFAVVMSLSGPGGIRFWQWLLVLYVGLGMIWAVTHFGTQYIRRRFVYLRSGYVKIRKRPYEITVMVFLSGLLAVAISAYTAKPGYWVLSPILGMGLLFGVACLIPALRSRTKKFAIYAVISIGVGILVHFMEPQASYDADIFQILLIVRSGFIKYFFFMGIAFLAGGILTLYFYVHHNPECKLEAE